MRFVFRVDASIQIGTGHVFRCLALANGLSSQGHECLFVCRENQGHLGNAIVNQGHGLRTLPSPTNNLSRKESLAFDENATWLGVAWEEDVDQTIDEIKFFQAEWLVIDHYALCADWERKIARVVPNIMVIDDLANRPHECTLLLDQNLGRGKADYEGFLSSGCHQLIGPKYALLRPEFRNLRGHSLNRRKDESIRRILISLGGVDRDNLTGQIVEVISSLRFISGVELDIVMGKNAPFLDDLRHKLSKLKVRATLSVDAVDMAQRMSLADFSIGAGGGTSWERACLGLPAVVVVLAENQIESARALKAAGAIKLILDAKETAKRLPSMLEQLINSNCLLQMSKAARSITDGNGVYRVLQKLNSINR